MLHSVLLTHLDSSSWLEKLTVFWFFKNSGKNISNAPFIARKWFRRLKCSNTSSCKARRDNATTEDINTGDYTIIQRVQAAAKCSQHSYNTMARVPALCVGRVIHVYSNKANQWQALKSQSLNWTRKLLHFPKRKITKWQQTLLVIQVRQSRNYTECI